MGDASEFQYNAAFQRNLGWFTEADQLALRGKCVAIAGMGGVGGVHLTALTRLGIGAFHIADFDKFSLANFNRQTGANIHTIGQSKLHVMEQMALAINPELRITRFDEGVTEQNLETFLAGVDLFVDGFDFFVMDMRRRVFARCHELGIPAITAGPIGMSTALLAFSPDGMSFEQYFRMEGRSEDEQYLRFYVGLVPKALHRPYLVDPTRLNLATKSGPSTSAACELCAGVAAITAIKFLLRRGDPMPAPWNQQYDAFRGILRKTRLTRGLDGPLWRLKLRLAGPKIIARMRQQPAPPPAFEPNDPIDEILHAARWAPSGDNEQPWRFEKSGDEAILVHLSPRDATNVYHYRDDEPNVLAAGMFLESLRIAASLHGRRLEWHVASGPDPLRLRIVFTIDANIAPDRLYSALGQRSVDRNPYRRRSLTSAEQRALESALDGGQLSIEWYPTMAARWRLAGLGALATSIRLSMPETRPIHEQIIDWTTNLSPTKIPAGALGLSSPTLRIMRWSLQSWQRTQLLNRLGATIAAALQMDYLPMLSSAAAFTLRTPLRSGENRSVEARLEAGMYIQRFWLTAASLGLAIHPAMAVLIFADYGQRGLRFTESDALRTKAQRLAKGFRQLFGAAPDDFVFMGRIGEPLRRMGVSRSVRQPVADLMVPVPDTPSSVTEAAASFAHSRLG